MVLCECGCGQETGSGGKKPPNRFIYGHNLRLYERKSGWKQKQEAKDKISKRHKGVPKTESHKKKMSENNWMRRPGSSDRYKGKNNPMYGKSPSPLAGTGHGSYYDSPLQGKIWLKSSYELAYAKYLDSIHELWMYELETFELLGEMSYKPDFFLPRLEKFVEIKGYLFPEDKLKIQKFQEEYPWDLEVLYKKDLLSLGIIVK